MKTFNGVADHSEVHTIIIIVGNDGVQADIVLER